MEFRVSLWPRSAVKGCASSAREFPLKGVIETGGRKSRCCVMIQALGKTGRVCNRFDLIHFHDHLSTSTCVNSLEGTTGVMG